MKRIIEIWLLLLVVQLAGSGLLVWLALLPIDLRFENYLQWLVIPAVQSVVLVAVYARPRLDAGLLPAPAPLLLAVDAVVLAVAYGTGGLDGPELSVWLSSYAAVKGLAAALLILQSGLSRSAPLQIRVWSMLAGIALTAYSVDYWLDWMEPLPARVVAGWPPLFQWLFFYGTLFVLSLMLLFRLQTLWRPRSAAAVRLLDGAAAVAVLSALIIAVGFYNQPWLNPPWNSIVRATGLVFLSFALSAAVRHHRGH